MLTAVVGITIGITVLFLAKTIIFNAAISALAIMIVYELLQNCGCLKFKLHSAVCFVFTGAMPFLVQFLAKNITFIYIFAALCILVMLCGFIKKHEELQFDKLCFMIAVTVLTSTAMSCLVTLKNMNELHGVCYVVICLAGAWLSDAAAYFVGTFFGRHKLCPTISPKKTVEGAVGGVIVGAAFLELYVLCYSLFMGAHGHSFSVNYTEMAVIGIICGLLSIVGDLTASIIKRQNNIKDFGRIMPGHGGVLDRFDSVLVVAPFLAFTLKYFSVFQ